MDKYKEHFAALAATGIPIVLYLDPTLREYGEALESEYPNVRVAEYMAHDKGFLQNGSYSLPATRNHVKDTADYMCVQLMKLRLVAKASLEAGTPWMAWIDFGIFHMFEDKGRATEILKEVALGQWPTDAILSPGCWDERPWAIWDAICWRHCGSFLLGASGLFAAAAQEQDALVREGLPRLTWEVNYWSKMACFRVYKANHNLSLLTALTGESAASPDQDTGRIGHHSAS